MPEIAQASPYRIGARVAWGEGSARRQGEIVTYRSLGKRRIVNVKTDDGAIETVVIDDGDTVTLAARIDETSARVIAEAVLDGQRLCISVTTQINLLAAAVIALSDEKKEAKS